MVGAGNYEIQGEQMPQENPNHSLALQMYRLEAYLQQQSYFGLARQRERYVMEEMDKPTNIFIAAALAQIRDRAMPEAKQRYEAQRLYARWLVLQQARLDVSNEMILQRSGLDKELLTLVQTGLAKFDDGRDEQWSFFAALLADPEHDYDWVEAVLLGALGLEVDEKILDEVIHDINQWNATPWLQSSKTWLSFSNCEDSIASKDDWFQTDWNHLSELFMGRQRELNRLLDWTRGLDSPKTLVLLGEPGSGKSTTLRHLVYQLTTDNTNQSVIWHRAASETPQLICEHRQFLGALPATPASYGVNWDVLDTQLQQTSRLIIILDGLDEVDATEFSALLPDRPNCLVLMACRSVVNSKPHWADIITLEPLKRNDSVRLLQSYQQRTTVNEVFFDKTAEELGDLPLAIRLAGYFLRYFSTYRDQELVPYLARVLQANLVRDMFPRETTKSSRWFTLKALLAVYALLESGDPVDRLARRVMSYLGTVNSDSLFSDSFVRLSENVEKGVTIVNALERLSQIGVLDVNAQGERQRYTLHDGLSEAVNMVNKRFHEGCVSDILFARSIGQPLGKSNASTTALASVGRAHSILQERYEDIRLLKVTSESVIYEAFDTVNRQPVIIKQARWGECTPSQHSPICRHYTQVSVKLQWLAEHNIPAPRYQGIMHIEGKSFLVVTKLEGVSLEVAQYTHSLSERGKWCIILELCRQVTSLHERGVVHLDLKPHNIFIDSQGKPWLADWGAAHSIWDEDDVFSPHLAWSRPIPAQAKEAIKADITAIGAVVDFLLPNSEPGLEPILWKAYHKDAGYRSVAELQQALLSTMLTAIPDSRRQRRQPRSRPSRRQRRRR